MPLEHVYLLTLSRLISSFVVLRSFFQGAVNDIGSDFRDDHVRIHFHLRNEIMIGKKKANNVQFISQVRKSLSTLCCRQTCWLLTCSSVCTNSAVRAFDGSLCCPAGR